MEGASSLATRGVETLGFRGQPQSLWGEREEPSTILLFSHFQAHAGLRWSAWAPGVQSLAQCILPGPTVAKGTRHEVDHVNFQKKLSMF